MLFKVALDTFYYIIVMGMTYKFCSKQTQFFWLHFVQGRSKIIPVKFEVKNWSDIVNWRTSKNSHKNPG